MGVGKTKAKCEFCDKLFLERNLFAHSCLRKARWNDDGRQADLALRMFMFYLKSAYPLRKRPTRRDFIHNDHYAYFYDFAGFLLREEPWDVEAFMRYLVRSQKPIKMWKWTCNGFVPVPDLTMPPWLRMRAG